MLNLGLLLVTSGAAQGGVKNTIIQPGSPLMATFPWFSPLYYVSREVCSLFISASVCVLMFQRAGLMLGYRRTKAHTHSGQGHRGWGAPKAAS